MARDVLRVDKIPSEVKEELAKIALRRFGVSNASLLVRSLIGDLLLEDSKVMVSEEQLNLLGKGSRPVRINLPVSVIERYEELGDSRLTPAIYYMVSVLMEHVGHAQLVVDEIEVVRRSNLELAAVNVNLSAINRAFELLVREGQLDEKDLVEVLVKLRKDLKKHTDLVLSILNKKTVLWDARHQGKGVRKEERN